jgi:peptide chain release factor 3
MLSRPKYKQFEKGLQQLTEEGLAQLFIQDTGRNGRSWGRWAPSNLDVIQHRLTHEYGASCAFQNLPFFRACWVTAEDPADLKEFVRFKDSKLALDKDKNYVWFADSQWEMNMMVNNNPKIQFHTTSEFKLKQA